MTQLTLASLMAAVTTVPDDELQNPVEILALLKSGHSNSLLDAMKASDRTAYLSITTASADPVTFYAEEPSESGGTDEAYMTYGMLRNLGKRLGWNRREDPVFIESALTVQGVPVKLDPIGLHGSLIIARELDGAVTDV